MPSPATHTSVSLLPPRDDRAMSDNLVIVCLSGILHLPFPAPRPLPRCVQLHHDAIRGLLKEYGGYESATEGVSQTRGERAGMQCTKALAG